MIARTVVLGVLLGLGSGAPALAQSAPVAPTPLPQGITPMTIGLVGKWGSTMNGFDKDLSPPYYYSENVVLTISANHNIHIERTRVEKGHTAGDTWMADGVYTMPAPGIMALTFATPMGQIPGVWKFVVNGNTMWIIDDGTGIQRKYFRIFTQYY